MLAALTLALTTKDLATEPGVICQVEGPRIEVLFGKQHHPTEFVMDKFAVVQAGTLRGGEWRDVVDASQDVPIRFSPYRPGIKRLVIDTRRQLSVSWGKRDGKPYVVPAFPRPGRYTLVFSDSLEIDLEDMVDWTCVVRVREAAPSRRVEAPASRR